MDQSLDVPYGPNPVQRTGTVTVPRELLREIGVEAGDRVHWALSEEVPGALLLIPSKLLARVMPELHHALKHVGS